MEFLQNGEGAGGSDAILGIVQQMAETLEADLKESKETEAAAKDTFASLIASKEAEIAAAGTAVEGKTAKAGELAVSLVEAKNALADTKDAMADDEKMKESLATGCATKEKEWDARCKARAEEVQAISEAIEMLNVTMRSSSLRRRCHPSCRFRRVQACARRCECTRMRPRRRRRSS